MRKLLLLVAACVVFGTPLSAQHFTDGATKVVSDFKVPFIEMMGTHGTGPRRLQKQAQLSQEISDAMFVFPVVGSTPPRNGFQFRSETTVVNNRGAQQRVAMFYFPAAGSGGNASNCSLPGKVLTLDPFEWIAWPDYVGTVFNASGLGSVIVMGVDANGNLDSNALLDGMSRIYTPVPGTNGQASQSFPGVSINVQPGVRLYAYGLRQDPSFRTNVGIFNYDFLRNLRRSFDLTANGTNGSQNFSIDVDPCNLVQFPVPGSNYGIFELSAVARDGGALWYGYGSTNDNATGDNWSAILH